MSRIVKIVIYLLTFTLVVFIVTGFLFVSDETRRFVETIWLSWIMGTAALSLVSLATAAYLGFTYLHRRGRRLSPDENGNFPVFEDKGRWINANLIGVEQQPHAWMVWQATNNRSTGSQARELFTRPALNVPLLPAGQEETLPFISARGQSDVIDAIAEEVK